MNDETFRKLHFSQVNGAFGGEMWHISAHLIILHSLIECFHNWSWWILKQNLYIPIHMAGTHKWKIFLHIVGNFYIVSSFSSSWHSCLNGCTCTRAHANSNSMAVQCTRYRVGITKSYSIHANKWSFKKNEIACSYRIQHLKPPPPHKIANISFVLWAKCCLHTIDEEIVNMKWMRSYAYEWNSIKTSQ